MSSWVFRIFYEYPVDGRRFRVKWSKPSLSAGYDTVRPPIPSQRPSLTAPPLVLTPKGTSTRVAFILLDHVSYLLSDSRDLFGDLNAAHLLFPSQTCRIMKTKSLKYWCINLSLHTGLSKKIPDKFGDTCSVRADWLCIGYLGQGAERGRDNSNTQEFFCTTL